MLRPVAAAAPSVHALHHRRDLAGAAALRRRARPGAASRNREISGSGIRRHSQPRRGSGDGAMYRGDRGDQFVALAARVPSGPAGRGTDQISGWRRGGGGVSRRVRALETLRCDHGQDGEPRPRQAVGPHAGRDGDFGAGMVRGRGDGARGFRFRSRARRGFQEARRSHGPSQPASGAARQSRLRGARPRPKCRSRCNGARWNWRGSENSCAGSSGCWKRQTEAARGTVQSTRIDRPGRAVARRTARGPGAGRHYDSRHGSAETSGTGADHRERIAAHCILRRNAADRGLCYRGGRAAGEVASRPKGKSCRMARARPRSKANSPDS